MKDFELRTWRTEDAVWFINDSIANMDRKQINYAIVVDGQTVGDIGIFVKDDVYEKSAELGYWLAENY